MHGLVSDEHPRPGPAPFRPAPPALSPRRAAAYRPGGRWERILSVIEREPMAQGRIVAATAIGGYPMITERRKVFAALSDMHDQGLVSRCPGGWIATAKGAQALWEESHVA